MKQNDEAHLQLSLLRSSAELITANGHLRENGSAK